MGFWNKKDDGESAESTPGKSTGPDAATKTTSPLKSGTTTPPKPPAPSATGGAKSSTESAGSLTGASREEALLARFGKLRSALGKGTVIQGKLSFDTPVSIDGKLSGEIFSSKALIVGTGGEIDAQVEVSQLIVMGTVRGNVKAADRIELLSGGKLFGDISTPVFIVEEGAQFDGSCMMKGNGKVVAVPNKS